MLVLTKSGIKIAHSDVARISLDTLVEGRLIVALPLGGRQIYLTPVASHILSVAMLTHDGRVNRTEPTHTVDMLTDDNDYAAIIRTEGLYEALRLDEDTLFEIATGAEALAVGPSISNYTPNVFLPFMLLNRVAKPRFAAVTPKATAKTAQMFGEPSGDAMIWNGYRVYKSGTIINAKGKEVGYMKGDVKVLEYKLDGKRGAIKVSTLVDQLFNN